MHSLKLAFVGLLATVSTLLVASPQSGAQAPADQSPASNEMSTALDALSKQELLAQTLPGARIGTWRGGTSVYGPAFSHGATAKASAEAFRRTALPLLGIAAEEVAPFASFIPQDNPGGNSLGLMYNKQTGTYKFTAQYYTQVRDGLEVYGSRMTVLTRNQANNPLVLAKLHLRELGAFRVNRAQLNRPNLAAALASARAALGNEAVIVGQPRAVIWAGVEEMVVKPAVALEFVVEADNPAQQTYKAQRLLTDIATGAILHQEDLLHDVDVTGNVSGRATTGNGADTCFPTQIMPMPYARVGIAGNFVFADVSGNFTIPNAGSSPVVVDSEVRGQYFRVINTTTPGGGNTVMSQNVTPPGPANFLYNDPDVAGNPGQYKRAEVNAYIHANVVRDYLLQHHPTFPTISNEVNFPVNVNLSQTCNAFYSSLDQTINFYNAGATCSNTANSTVVHHEYGHRIVNAAGSGQGAYGEGFGDTMGVLISDSPCLGDGFHACGDCLRTADNNCQYQTSNCSSCGSGIHACGQLFSGCVWSTRNNLAITHPGTYREILSNLMINSVLVHSGSSITPQITIDVLTLDDNDGNIENGTPHYHQINNGFTDHNMPGPPLIVGLSINPATHFASLGSNGGPFSPATKDYTVENVEDEPMEYAVTCAAPWITVLNASGTLAPHAVTTVTVSINANAASLPNGLYNTVINFTNLTNGLGDTFRTVNLEIGRVAYPSTDTPKPLPDLTPGVTSTINVPDTYCMGDVDVAVNISHTNIGELIVELTSPQGTVVRLHNRTGGSADNIIKTYSDGTVNPDGPGMLANFSGQVVGGNWQLKISDHASTDSGTLNSWELRIVPTGEVCPPIASHVTQTVPVLVTSDITLNAVSSVGSLDYVILSLPANGTLFDPNGGAIGGVPYTILSNGNVVRYKPDPDHAGPDAFTYKAHDGLDSNIANVNITVGGPQLAHSWNMDTNPGWIITGPASNGWAWGVPCGCGTTTGRLDPPSGFTGTNVYGYNLNGYYTNSMPEYSLTTTPFNCSNLTGTELRFQRWLGIESATFDHAKVQVSNDGVNWTTVWNHTGGSVNPVSWTLVSHNISAVADGQANIQLRWTMGTTDTSVVYQGWNIDDVQIWGIRPPCVSDCSGDGQVNVSDLLMILNAWGPCNLCTADVAPPGGDGQVNVSDMLAVINGWGACP